MAAQRNGPILGQVLEFYQGSALPILVNIPDLRGALAGAASFLWLGLKPPPSGANKPPLTVMGKPGAVTVAGTFIGCDKPAAGITQFGLTVRPADLRNLPPGVALQHEFWVAPSGGVAELVELGDAMLFATGGSFNN